MSEELASRFERDMSATDETIERARRAREQCAVLDIDWEIALDSYNTRANQDPKKLVRFSNIEHFPDTIAFSQNNPSDKDEIHETSSTR